MLKKLTCDKFRIDPKTGKPFVVEFEDGLNVIRGTDENKNSIGKSTLLLLIDFALGGEDYENHCSVAVNKIGHHTIYFVLEINGETLCCSRSTSNANWIVYYKDDSFQEEVSAISVDDYLSELNRLYKLEEGFTFRQMVSPFIRVYQRQTTSEKSPLQAAYTQPVYQSILDHLKLHGVYNDLNTAMRERDEIDDKIKTYKKSSDYKYIRKITKKEYEENLKLIEKYRLEKDSLLKDYQEKVYDAKAAKNLESSSIAATLADLETRRDNLIARKASIESLSNINLDNFYASLEELKEFFKGVEFNSLEETQKFHSEMASIFNSQAKKERAKIDKEIAELDEEIKVYREKYKSINHIETLPETVIRQHYDYAAEIKRMEDENKKYLDNLQNMADLEAKKLNVIEKSKTILSNLQNDINEGLKELNKNFYEGRIACPKLTFNGIDKKYTFYTPTDEGTGTSQKGVILFDIYTLGSTILPIVVHDTIMLKHIEDYTLQQIIKLYNGVGNKQIIIAYDGKKDIDEEAQKILATKTRMELAGGSMALFGEEFNK